MLRMILAAAALTCGAPAAAVQPAAPAPAPGAALDPAAIAEARSLLRETGFDYQFEASVVRIGNSSFTTILREMETQAGEDFPDELEGRIRRVVAEHLAALASEMRASALEDSARIYARYFTAAELRELRQLQTQPVMVKFQRFAAPLMDELMQIGVAASARRMPQLHERLRSELEAWQRDRQPARTS